MICFVSIYLMILYFKIKISVKVYNVMLEEPCFKLEWWVKVKFL